MTEQNAVYASVQFTAEHPILELSQVIRAIAGKVELPEEWNQKLETCAFATFERPDLGTDNKRLLEFQAGLLSGHLKSLFRHWRAAAALHFCLKEKGAYGPKWRNWMTTGMPAVLDSEEQKRALHFLECIVQDHEDQLLAYLHGKIEVNLGKMPSVPPLFSKADQQWINSLGFERFELIEFLDEVEIPHDFVNEKVTIDANDPLPDDSVAPQPTLAPADTGLDSSASDSAIAVENDNSQAVRFSHVVDHFSGNQTEICPAPTDPAAKKANSPLGDKFNYDSLDDTIDEAIKRANGSYRTSLVWKHLKELALSSYSPFTGALSDTGALIYAKDEYSEVDEDRTDTLSKNALDLRLKRRWKNLGEVGPRR